MIQVITHDGYLH